MTNQVKQSSFTAQSFLDLTSAFVTFLAVNSYLFLFLLLLLDATVFVKNEQ